MANTEASALNPMQNTRTNMASADKPKRKNFFARVLSFLMSAVTGLGLLAIMLVLIYSVVGFARYTWTVSSYGPSEIVEDNDAIVVLTGGEDRVNTGLKLLNDKKGNRLLISGVHPKTSKQAIGQLASENTNQLDCCVDIGHVAEDTIGNAKEVSEWAVKNSFASLIMVTSDYHVPRALLEMQKTVKDISVKAYPVTSPAFQQSDWYKKPQTWKLLLSEFSKLQASKFADLKAKAKLKLAELQAKLAEAGKPKTNGNP